MMSIGSESITPPTFDDAAAALAAATARTASTVRIVGGATKLGWGMPARGGGRSSCAAAGLIGRSSTTPAI